MKKKLIKRIEELSIENKHLKSINIRLADENIMLVRNNQLQKSNTYSSQDFKKGDILIREWNDGDIDYCKFGEKVDEYVFKDGFFFYSVTKNKGIHDMSDYGGFSKYRNLHGDTKFDWRKATEEEISKLNKILGKEE